MSTVDLPNIREPFIDTRSGQISRPWWIWLQQLMTRIGGSDGTDLSALTALVTALIATARAHDNEINGQVALPPTLSEELAEFDQALVGAVPLDYVSDAVAAVQAGNLSQFASTTSAQLAGVISNETGSGALVFGTSPTLNTPIVVGTTTGSLGEYTSNTTTGTAATSGVALNATSLVNLPAGDWDVEGLIQAQPAAGTTVSSVNTGISTASAAFQNITAGFVNASVLNGISTPAGVQMDLVAPRTRLVLGAPTTVYLVAQVSFAVSTLSVHGFIRARRISQ